MKKAFYITVFGVVVVSFIGCAGSPTWKSFAMNHTIAVKRFNSLIPPFVRIRDKRDSKVEETPEKVESSTDDKKVIKSPDEDNQVLLAESKEGEKMIFQIKVIKSPDGDSQALLVESKEGIKMIFQ